MGRGARRNTTEDKMVNMIDRLEKFRQFEEEILPALQRAIAKGVSAEEIYKKYEAHLAARTITIALTDPDAAKANAAIREAMDRSKGKATEKVELEHKYSKLKREEVEALLESQLAEAGVLPLRKSSS
jgi:hypothetical protein